MRITLTEYAAKVGKSTSTVRRMVLRGNLPAVKSGGTWLIEEDEPYLDHRFTEPKTRENVKPDVAPESVNDEK